MSLRTISESRCFGGVQGTYSHASTATGTEMRLSVFVPEAGRSRALPVVVYLSGLSCTEENFTVKAGAQRYAAELGLIVVAPDTSPRGPNVADDPAYDLGQGAGFYVDATETPWDPHFKMWSYITEELPSLVFRNFELEEGAQGITGHSMGGHGALTIALTYPDRFKSVSAFAPIANPSNSDWGRKQLGAYLGPESDAWYRHDSSLLLREKGWKGQMLIDQGASDQFLDLLKPEALAAAIAETRQPAIFRMQPGYDHSYFFVASFMEEHVTFHAEALYA